MDKIDQEKYFGLDRDLPKVKVKVRDYKWDKKSQKFVPKGTKNKWV